MLTKVCYFNDNGHLLDLFVKIFQTPRYHNNRVNLARGKHTDFLHISKRFNIHITRDSLISYLVATKNEFHKRPRCHEKNT